MKPFRVKIIVSCGGLYSVYYRKLRCYQSELREQSKCCQLMLHYTWRKVSVFAAKLTQVGFSGEESGSVAVRVTLSASMSVKV